MGHDFIKLFLKAGLLWKDMTGLACALASLSWRAGLAFLTPCWQLAHLVLQVFKCVQPAKSEVEWSLSLFLLYRLTLGIQVWECVERVGQRFWARRLILWLSSLWLSLNLLGHLALLLPRCRLDSTRWCQRGWFGWSFARRWGVYQDLRTLLRCLGFCLFWLLVCLCGWEGSGQSRRGGCSNLEERRADLLYNSAPLLHCIENLTTLKRIAEWWNSFVANGKERFLGANESSVLLSLVLILHDWPELKHATSTPQWLQHTIVRWKV